MQSIKNKKSTKTKTRLKISVIVALVIVVAVVAFLYLSKSTNGTHEPNSEVTQVDASNNSSTSDQNDPESSAHSKEDVINGQD